MECIFAFVERHARGESTYGGVDAAGPVLGQAHFPEAGSWIRRWSPNSRAWRSTRFTPSVRSSRTSPCWRGATRLFASIRRAPRTEQATRRPRRDHGKPAILQNSSERCSCPGIRGNEARGEQHIADDIRLGGRTCPLVPGGLGLGRHSDRRRRLRPRLASASSQIANRSAELPQPRARSADCLRSPSSSTMRFSSRR